LLSNEWAADMVYPTTLTMHTGCNRAAVKSREATRDRRLALVGQATPFALRSGIRSYYRVWESAQFAVDPHLNR